MYNASIDNGISKYRSYVQLISNNLIEGSDSIPLENRKYAKLVSILNGNSSNDSPLLSNSILNHQVILYTELDGITNLPSGFTQVWCFSDPSIKNIGVDALEVFKWQIIAVNNSGDLKFLNMNNGFVHQATISYINNNIFD